MGKQRIHSTLGEFETLTQEELHSTLWHHETRVEQVRLAGMKVIRFPPIYANGNGGTLALNCFGAGASAGPDLGFIWEVQRVTVASSSLTDQADYGIYIGSDATYGPQHLIDLGVAYITMPVVTPAVPATTVAAQNPNNFPVQVVISGGTVTAVTVNGVQVLAGDGTAYVPAFGTIVLTYSSAPTWVWTGIGINNGLNVNNAWFPSKHSAWVFGGEQVYTQVFNSLAANVYSMTGVALEVPAEMQGKIMLLSASRVTLVNSSGGNVTAIVESKEKPTPFMRGKFAIYETPEGGLHIAYRVEGQDEDRHIALPAAAIKMAGMMGDKLPFANLIGVGLCHMFPWVPVRLRLLPTIPGRIKGTGLPHSRPPYSAFLPRFPFLKSSILSLPVACPGRQSHCLWILTNGIRRK